MEFIGKLNKHVTIRTTHSHLLEYLSEPDTKQEWISLTIPMHTQFVSRAWNSTRDFDEECDYKFTVNDDHMEIVWSGTFLIAQATLENYLPESLIMEIAGFFLN